MAILYGHTIKTKKTEKIIEMMQGFREKKTPVVMVILHHGLTIKTNPTSPAAGMVSATAMPTIKVAREDRVQSARR